MTFKDRQEPVELKLLRYLHPRIVLSEKQKQYYLNLLQGYKGECKFDEKMISLSHHGIALNDLMLEQGNTFFQIDSLLLLNEKIHMFEIKNYEGDYFIEGDKWYTKSGVEIRNPLLQLKRSETLLRQLLQLQKINFPIESHLVFINPAFTLYQAPLELPALFYPQIDKFFQRLASQSLPSLTPRHHQLAKQLVSLHVKESPFSRLPAYNYDDIKKGITCPKCSTFVNLFNKTSIVCKSCDYREEVNSAILRNLDEYTQLFPNRRVTTNDAYDWCGGIKSRWAIRQLLTREYERIGKGKASFYVKKPQIK